MTKYWKRVTICLVLIVFGIAIYNYLNMYHSEGYYSITKKKVINQNYYIYVKDGNGVVQLKCLKQVYDKVIVNENLKYHIYYMTSKLSPTKGKLFFIKFNESIDNRDNTTKD